jgi:PAS domain S-box-containing protein
LANQDRLLADVIDGSSAIISAFDHDGRIMLANSVAAQFLKTTKEALIGTFVEDHVPADRALKFGVRHAEVMATGQPQVLETTLSVRGNERTLLAARYPLRNTAGVTYGTASIMTDITQQKQIEAELRRSEEQTRNALEALEKALDATRRTEEKFRHVQKMEAVGRLAGGIAHDFNNLLTVILGNSSEVLAGLRPEDPLHEIMSEIEKAGQRAAALTRQLLAFSRKQVLEPRIVNVNELIVGAEKMLRRIVGEDIEVTLLLDTRPQCCKLDKGQFEQVLLNLVVNARDAMMDGGRLTIETTTVSLNAAYVEEHPDASAGEHVQITVSDTGIGIPKEVQLHIFDPFFTTKGIGQGTGLGLSTVYGIVKQSGGSIWLYSEPNQGTTFKLYFPTERGMTVDAVPAQANVITKRGKETILLVEDDEQVRTTIAAILRRAGYHVIAATNGGEALLICEQHGGTIPLLLTDVVMPKLNGRKLAERLRQIRPAMRAIFMSGYTENVVIHYGILDAYLDFIAKPITSEMLLTKVREVLDR